MGPCVKQLSRGDGSVLLAGACLLQRSVWYYLTGTKRPDGAQGSHQECGPALTARNTGSGFSGPRMKYWLIVLGNLAVPPELWTTYLWNFQALSETN